MSIKIEVKRVIVMDGEEADLFMDVCKLAQMAVESKQTGKPIPIMAISSDRMEKVISMLKRVHNA